MSVMVSPNLVAASTIPRRPGPGSVPEIEPPLRRPGAASASGCISRKNLRYSCAVTRRLAEVARQVGVSEATVSRVLNGKPGVSDATREAVLTALDVLGYERPTRL